MDEVPPQRTPADLLALGLGATESGPGGEAEPSDEELEAFLCAMPDLELHGSLGQGGMGRVYKARQIRLDRFVAVKLMNPTLGDEPEFRERFEREARALARLDHPGVVRVHDFGEAGGRFYLIMELVEGTDLRALMAEGLEPDAATEIVAQLCDALAYAHDRGVVHRDVKPENVLVDRRGRVRVADFGLAKLQQREQRATTRHVLGTPQYMAPEQMSDPGSVDHRADVFAIGVVFYEMLTGQLPVGRFPPPSELGRGDAKLDAVVMRALESNREKRFQAASEIGSALRSRAVDDPENFTHPDISVPAKPQSRSLFRFGLGLVAGVGVVGAVLVARTEGDVDPDPDPVPEVVAAPVVAEAVAVAEPPVFTPPPANRWPGSDLPLLPTEAVAVVGVDLATLLQAPALHRIAKGFEGDPSWNTCKPQVIDKTHKVIISFDGESAPLEMLVHADWTVDELESCLRIAGEGRKITREAFGNHVRFTVAGSGKPKSDDGWSVAVAKEGARAILSLRDDVIPEHLTERLASVPTGSDIGDRLARKVDLGAPIWVFADPLPFEQDLGIVGAWGQLELWKMLQIDTTVRFGSEEDAVKAAAMANGWIAIANAEAETKVDVEVTTEGKDLVAKGSVPVPQTGKSSGTFSLNPKGDAGFSFDFSL